MTFFVATQGDEEFKRMFRLYIRVSQAIVNRIENRTRQRLKDPSFKVTARKAVSCGSASYSHHKGKPASEPLVRKTGWERKIRHQSRVEKLRPMPRVKEGRPIDDDVKDERAWMADLAVSIGLILHMSYQHAV